MKRTNFDTGWTFHRGERDRFGSPEDQMKEESVILPHDFTISTDPDPEAIGAVSTGYYRGGYGIYTKTFSLPESEKGRKFILEFDGVYMNSEVVINGDLIVRHPYGYTAFHADLTDHLHFDRPNKLEVLVNNTAEPNTRWYSGSGIYRSVELLSAPSLHIAPWGLFARTLRVTDGTGHVSVETCIENETGSTADVWVVTTLTDESGKQVASGRIKAVVPANGSCKEQIPLAIDNVGLWDPDSPCLYTATSELIVDGAGTDVADTRFGVRTFSADVKNGFVLNGKPMKLKGGCIHHDNGLLGAASYEDSEYRKVRIHKEHGYNALRCAHNPPSRWLLKACDELGILVIDEAFDMWRVNKKANDYHLYFEDWWQRDVWSMVVRDRNHPSIIFWSIGNEIRERDGFSDGARWSKRLTDFIRSLDDTRLVTSALNNLQPPAPEGGSLTADDNPENEGEAIYRYWSEKTEAYAAPLDVVGYNYLDSRYEQDGKTFPERIICGLESFPVNIDVAWELVERLPYVIGDFTWTSYDYIGEAGIGKVYYGDPESIPNLRYMSHLSEYPWRLANDSDFDLCGFERPQLAYRKIVWGSDETFISVRNPQYFGLQETISRWGWPDCIDSWNWAGYDGNPIGIDVYSAAEKVELYINGEKIEEAPAGRQERYTARFETVFIPGEILAISFSGGQEISRKRLLTAGRPVGMRLTPEQTQIRDDGHALCFVLVEYVDANGQRVPDFETETTASVEGPATLLAFGVARPKTEENYTIGKFTSYEGRLQAILRSDPGTGEAILTVSGGGFTEKIGIQVGRQDG